MTKTILRAWATAVVVSLAGLGNALAQAPITTRSFPLNNTSGVPFFREPGLPEYRLDGFEVDAQENVYFLARKDLAGKSWLTAYAGTTRRYSRELPVAAQRLTFDPAGKLLSLAADEMRLYTLSPAAGSLAGQQTIQRQKPGSAYQRNANMLLPQGLFIEYARYGAGSTEMSYQQYALDGRYVTTSAYLYRLPAKVQAAFQALPVAMWEYVGSYQGHYYFIDAGLDDGFEVNRYTADGRKSTFRIPGKHVGLPLFGEYEFKKIRNGKLYLLSRRQSTLLLTAVALQ